MSKLIFGCGYLGQRVARLWRSADEEVWIVTRSVERAERLQQDGFHVLVADVTDSSTLQNLPAVESVLFAVGYDRSSSLPITQVYPTGVKNVLAALPSAPQHFVYISSTGVYGPADGAWIDESTPTNPQRDGGRASLAAETVLGSNTTILRLAGIYGPGRIPYLDKLRAGEPIAAPSAGWLNLIHVDDAASIVTTVAKNSAQQRSIFCVSDGQPVVRGEYYAEVARCSNAPPPRFASPPAGSPAAARALSDKRVSNRLLLESFDVHLRYPSYREGLAAVFGED